MKITTKLTPEQVKEAEALEAAQEKQDRNLYQDQRYQDLIHEIATDRERRDMILLGSETPANLIGFRGLDNERYYPDMAKRFNDYKLEHMKNLTLPGMDESRLEEYLEKVKRRGMSKEHYDEIMGREKK